MPNWINQKPETRLIELVGASPPKKPITLESAIESYSGALEGDRAHQVNWFKKMFPSDLKKKLISEIKISDTNKLFKLFAKTRSTDTAYGARGVIFNAIRYACTGQVPQAKPTRLSNGIAADTPKDQIGRLEFARAKLSSVVRLVPLYTPTGRFAWFKAEVQSLISTCEADEVAIIKGKKKDLQMKEAKAMMSAASKVIRNMKPKWIIKWNPLEGLFIAMRESQFLELTNNQKGPK